MNESLVNQFKFHYKYWHLFCVKVIQRIISTAYSNQRENLSWMYKEALILACCPNNYLLVMSTYAIHVQMFIYLI